MRKLKENDSLHFLILSPFPPSLSISASKFVTFCRKMLKYCTFVAMSQKSEHTRYEEIILGRFRCLEAPQDVPAWTCRISCQSC